MSLVALKPKRRASYYAKLFVVSNSSLQDRDMVSWEGGIKTTLAPALSLEEAPTNCFFQTKVLGVGSSQKVIGCFLISIGG
jgi:hypothetical protein